MVTIRHSLAAIAAFGLSVSPAMAQTRSAQALPAPSEQVDSSAISLASQPTEDESSLGGRGFSPILLVALLLIIAGIVIAAGGGNGESDSPG